MAQFKLIPITHKQLWLLKKFGLRTLIKPFGDYPVRFATGPVGDSEDKALVAAWEKEFSSLSRTDLIELKAFHHKYNEIFQVTPSVQNCWVLVIDR